MSSIDSDTSSPQGPDLGQLIASSAASPSDAETEAIHAMVNPPAACPGCLARAGIPWPEGTTSQFCRACADRIRRIHQCARWNADREHQSAAGKARWVAAVARWWAGTGSAPLTIEAAQKYVTPDDIRGPGRLELSPELRDEIYRAWCAGYLLPVTAWFSDEKDEDDEVETPWEYDGAPLLMYRAGVSTRQGGGVSWSYILRNPSLTLLIRKTPLGGIIAQARLCSECLWRLTPLAALNELDLLVRRLWQMGKLGRIRRTRATSASARWQVSQVHLAHDVAHAPLAVEQVDRYVSRSRKQSVYEAARQDLTTLYTRLDDPLDSVFADDTDTLFTGGLEWEELYGDDDTFGMFDAFSEEVSSSAHRFNAEEPEPVEERASSMHRWGRRVSGITWSPGAMVSFVAYDKVLEGRLRGKSHMPPIWKANGWDGVAPVTRHEARLRRDALRALTLSTAVHAHDTSGASDIGASKALATPHQATLDDPWVMLDHQRDIFAYVVGRPSTVDTATDCPAPVDVAWLRRVVPDPNETNRSRWPTDPVWTVVQAPQFTDVPAEVRHLIRREVRSQQIAKRDRGAYGLVVSRTALAFADPKHWELSHALQTLYHVFEEESQKPGKDFAELVRRRRRELGLPVPSEGRVVPFRSHPEPTLPISEIDVEDAQDGPEDASADTPTSAVIEHRLALLRTERRLDELDVALDAATHAARAEPTSAHRRRVEELAHAYEHELRVHEAIRLRMSAVESRDGS